MDLSKIVSIGGKPGLYRMIGQTKSGFVVESLLDGRRMPAFPSQQVSSLDEISIYTTGEERPLRDVFKAIFDKEPNGRAPDHKADNGIILPWFEEVVPDYDRDMVKQSDIRKVVRWYNELLDAGLLKWEEEIEGEEPESGSKEADPGVQEHGQKAKIPTYKSKSPNFRSQTPTANPQSGKIRHQTGNK